MAIIAFLIFFIYLDVGHLAAAGTEYRLVGECRSYSRFIVRGGQLYGRGHRNRYRMECNIGLCGYHFNLADS